jgi:hypothetical protein
MTTMRTIFADPTLGASDLNAVLAFTQKLKKQDARIGKQEYASFISLYLTPILVNVHLAGSPHSPPRSPKPA